MLQRVKILNTSKKEEELFEDYEIQYIITEDFLDEHHPASVVAGGNPARIHEAPVNVAMTTNNSPGGMHRETVAFLPPDVPEGNHLSTDSGVYAGTTNITTGNMADSSTLITTRGRTSPTAAVDTSSQSSSDPIPDPVTQEVCITDSEQTPPTSPWIPPDQCVDNSSWGVTYDIKTFQYHADNWEFPWDAYATPIAEYPSNISPPLHSPMAEHPSNILSPPLHSPMAEHPSNILSPPLHSPMAEDPSNILSPPLHSPMAEDPSNIISPPLHSPMPEHTTNILSPPLHSPMAEDPSNILSPPLHSPMPEHTTNISSPLHSPSLDTEQDSTQQLGPLQGIDLQILWFMKSHVERDKDGDHEIVSPVEESVAHFPSLHHDFIQPVAGEIPRDIIPPVNHPPLPLGQPLDDFLSDQEVYVQPVEDSGAQLSTSAVFPAPPW